MLQLKLLCLLGIILGAGCASISNPFRNNDDTSDPLYAQTKSAKVDRIRAIGENANGADAQQREQQARQLADQIRTEDDPVLKLEMIRALQALAAPSSLEGIELALADSRPRIRLTACSALAKLNSSRAMDLLAATLANDSNLDVRVEATRGLANFKSQRALQALAIAVEDPNPAMQYTAVQAMRKVHSEDLGDNVQAWQQLAQTLLPSDSAELQYAEIPSNPTTLNR